MADRKESIWSRIGRKVLMKELKPKSFKAKADLCIFIAPDYDWLTSIMCSWLKDLLDVVAAGKSNMLGANAAIGNLESIIERHKDKRILLVYYGHGEDDALLTAPGLGNGKLRGEREDHDTLCIADQFENGGEWLIMAYCCSSARILGRSIRNMNSNNEYLGFRSVISYCLGTVERELAFKRPFGNTVRWFMSNGEEMVNAKAMLKEEYRRESEKWGSMEYERMDEKAMLVSMLLDHHRISVD